MSRVKNAIQWLAVVGALWLVAASWGANRLDIWTFHPGDPNDNNDDFDEIRHTFISGSLQPWKMYLYIDPGGNAIDPNINLAAVPTYQVLHGARKAAEAWNSVSISSFNFDDAIVPFDHTTARFPNLTVIPGATGFDGWNLLTFQDPILVVGGGAVALSIAWEFWQDIDLKSFINLPPGVIIVDPPGSNPPGGGGPGATARIDFDGDGYPDVIIEARKYKAGEVLESDTWLNQASAWHQWPDSPNDLPSTPGGQVTRPQTLGTLDIQGALTHEFGHLIGIAHSNIERATMYFAIKPRLSRYPTDVWDFRSLDVDDEIGAALLYPASDSRRGTIAGHVFDGRNFDGFPDTRTTGTIDAVPYAFVTVLRQMSTGTIPAYVPDKVMLTSPPLGTRPQDLDTSAAFWYERVTEVQAGDHIRVAQFPNPLSFNPSGRIVGATTNVLQFVPYLPAPTGAPAINIPAYVASSATYQIPGLPPYDKYVLVLSYNYDGSQGRNPISVPTEFFASVPALGGYTFAPYQPIPPEFYGGNWDMSTIMLLGPDGPVSGTITSLIPPIGFGDFPTSFTTVEVQAGQITPEINLYTNTGSLPANTTPTPLPGVTPTPPPPGSGSTFTPDAANDHLLPQESDWHMAAAVGDVDNDGDIDLYICNGVSGLSPSPISMVNRIWINTLWEPGANPPGTRFPGVRAADGQPKFEDRAFGADGIYGTLDDRLPIDLDSSFFAKMADFNNDGYLDIFVFNAADIIHTTGSRNRLYINRGGVNPAQAGFFEDWTARPRTDHPLTSPRGGDIPYYFTSTTLPGRFNRPVMDPLWLRKSTKGDAGDIDGDGDIDIVISAAFWLDAGLGANQSAGTPYYVYQMMDQILINHANDIDPNTRGFYFTDETLGLDNRFGEVIAAAVDPTNVARTTRQAADRLPPSVVRIYQPPETISGTYTEWGADRFQAVLAPMLGNNSLDLVMARAKLTTPPRNSVDLFFENTDVDGDGVADGYFRLANWGADATLPMPIGTSATFALATRTGLFGFGARALTPPNDDALVSSGPVRGGRGVCVADFDYHGYPQALVVNANVRADFYNICYIYDLLGPPFRTGPVWVGRGQTPAFGGILLVGGYGIEYGTELSWLGALAPPHTLLVSPAGTGDGVWLARQPIAEDFDHDADYDIYVAYSHFAPENIVPFRPVPNEYYRNEGFGVLAWQMPNRTLQCTSGTARGTYHALAFDFDMDNDLDIFQSNAGDSGLGNPKIAQNALLGNQIYRPDDYVKSGSTTLFHSSTDNPAFYDATVKFLPPYFNPLAWPPYGADAAKITITAAVGDLNSDGLSDLVYANGGLYSIAGDATDILFNHGEPPHQGARVFTPLRASWPGPAIWSYFGDHWLNHRVPAYHAVLADFDLDGDYDLLETTNGRGPFIYSNEDSADMLPLALRGTPAERLFNSIPDTDFLGDGILLPAGTNIATATMTLVSSLGPVPQLRDPGGLPPPFFQKKELNRRAAIGDFDRNGTIDIVIANGMPIGYTPGSPTPTGGAPNVLLMNGISPTPLGTFVDQTETRLPTQLFSFTSGTQTITYRAGIHDDTVDVATADFDGDGWLDIVFLNVSTFIPDDASSTTRFLDGANGIFHDTRAPGSRDSSFVLPSLRGTSPSRIIVADFDRKGDITEDINGNGVLDSGEDLNHNGLLDFFDTPGPDHRTGIFDSHWDIMITFTDRSPMLFLNQGWTTGTTRGWRGFKDVTDTNMPFIPYSVYGADIGDVDLDGDIDVALAISNQFWLRHVLLLMNDGEGRFTVAVNEVPVNNMVLPSPGVIDPFHVICRDVKLFDVDMDGDLDMLLSYSGITNMAMTGGALNALFVNRLIPENFNTLNRFRTFQAPFLIKRATPLPSSPTLTRLTPGEGVQGAVVQSTLVGQNLDPGIRSLYVGSGVTVVSVTRVAPSIFSIVFRVAPNAAAVMRDLNVVLNNGRALTLRRAFTVVVKPTAVEFTWRLYR